MIKSAKVYHYNMTDDKISNKELLDILSLHYNKGEICKLLSNVDNMEFSSNYTFN